MDPIKARREERMDRIAIIKKSILKAKNPDLDKIILLCSSEWGISLRVAKEYLKVAQFQIEEDAN